MVVLRCAVLCVLLALSGSAQASKLGTWARTTSAALKSKLPTLNGGKLAQTLAAGGLALSFVCGGLSGCDNAADSGNVTFAVELTNLYSGESVYFIVDGIVYRGYVVAGFSVNEIIVRVDGGSDEMVVHVDAVEGVVIVDHADLQAQVMLSGDWQNGEDWLEGRITAVFDDGYREITVNTIYYTDGTYEVLDDPFVVYVHASTTYEEGGYAFIAD